MDANAIAGKFRPARWFRYSPEPGAVSPTVFRSPAARAAAYYAEIHRYGYANDYQTLLAPLTAAASGFVPVS
ncbi:MAG: hypothetical protein AB1648_03905 [Pseudomonadota bacterium]|jgi:hypothetical protein